MKDNLETNNPTHRILVVDDDSDMRTLLAAWLDGECYDVTTAPSGPKALSQLDIIRPNLVVTDLYMDGMDGMTLMTEVHRRNPLMPVIMLSGQAQIRDAVKATHLGSTAFLTKPVDRDELFLQVRKALHVAAFEHCKPSDFGSGIIYRSAVMADLMENARMVADSDITVFIAGETGTGKEALAKAIHNASSRSQKRFIGVNCGAIPEQLLESELFGHEKGAFTGASTRHEGLFVAAEGGTLFLDEIGDMPLGLQVKLLRVLQDFEVRSVGSVRSAPVDVRIISATHNDLEKAVRLGEFREDLYYRLFVVPLSIPSLRERREDIPALIEHFLSEYAQKRDEAKKRFAPDAMEYLLTARWPGNVRQINNVVDLCATLNRGEILPLNLAKKALRDEQGQFQTLKEAKQDFEKKYLISVLRITKGHVANAARIAGRNRTEFYKLLSQHELDPTEFRRKGSPAVET